MNRYHNVIYIYIVVRMQEIEFENDRSSNSAEFGAEVGCLTVLVVVDRAGPHLGLVLEN
jgi:hypothetical protein